MVSKKQKWIFNICPYISVLPTPFSSKLVFLCTRHKAARLWLALLNMSAVFSGHLPERMLGAWRPGSEGDWSLCHPSQELPLSWCIIEPLNQLPPSLSPPSFLSRVENGSQSQRKKIETEIDREVKVTSLSFSYLHLRCYGLLLYKRTAKDGEVKGLVWALVSGFNCPLCQIGDNKQFEALSSLRSSFLSLPPARGEATQRTLKQDVSGR